MTDSQPPSQPATQPASRVAVAITLNAKASSLKTEKVATASDEIFRVDSNYPHQRESGTSGANLGPISTLILILFCAAVFSCIRCIRRTGKVTGL